MIQLTQVQYDSLVDSIYSTLMGTSIPCECGETNELGMGEMGEAHDAAQEIVGKWMGENDIEVI